MIEADQATAPPPSADDKEAAPPAPADPVNTVPLEGQYGTLFNYLEFLQQLHTASAQEKVTIFVKSVVNFSE